MERLLMKHGLTCPPDLACPPCLLIVFNRAKATRQVMEAIRAARPTRLYVAADGPRDRPGERELCEETRRIALAVDWPCEVRTLLRETNHGCRVGVSAAIDWFFEHEEEGVILEDDCLPLASFFPYCAELLERYRDDKRVMTISGCNFQDGRAVTSHSYYFSRYMHCWGWASWRRAWTLYDRDMAQWPEFDAEGGLRSWSGGDELFERHWRRIFERMRRREIDTWDYQWLFTCWAQGGLTCAPAENLVQNLGFGDLATHTTQAEHHLARMFRREMIFPLRHPGSMARNVAADRWEDVYVYGFRKKVLKKKLKLMARGALQYMRMKLSGERPNSGRFA
jgi:hypothetical protein